MNFRSHSSQGEFYMADIKNFGLTGVGNDVQLGKGGSRIKTNGTVIEARNAVDGNYVNIRGLDGVASHDMVTVQQLANTTSDLSNAIANSVSNAIDNQDGFHIVLGSVEVDGDGSWANGAVPLTDSTPISSAVDQMNTLLGLLVPAAPPTFPNGNTLSVTNTSGSTPLLANGATDRSGSSAISAGSSVTRTIANVNSNTFSNMGPASSGTVQLYINNSVVGTHTLTGSGDAGNYSGLILSNQIDYPAATPGFWKAITVAVTGGATLTGVNNFKINHTGATATNTVYFVRDNVTAVPVVTNTAVTQATTGTLAYSSSVPHYTNGTLTANAAISNLAGQTYYGGSDPFVITATNSIMTAKTLTYANLGITTPIVANTTSAVTITPVTFTIDGTNVHNVGTLTGVAKNVNGSSSSTSMSATKFLVKTGTAGSRIDELSVTVSGLGSSPNTNNAVRVVANSGDTPAGSGSTWTNSNSIQTYDATVVAGLLQHDQTNYSTGYLPVGPDLSSGRSGAQYVEFSFNRSVLSQFKINVTGTYAGCWIKLPGVSDNSSISVNAPNGWWNGFQPYKGAGVPGETGDTICGCASGTVMSGSSGAFQITFGTQSSTNSTGNQILVRFKLTAGQSISALSFTN